MSENHSVYLLQTREFIKSRERVYKIGKTKQEGVDRIKGYPKGTKLYLMIQVTDCDVSERVLLSIFRNKYKPRTDIGAEYFEGDLQQMKWDIINNCAGAKETPSLCQSLTHRCTII